MKVTVSAPRLKSWLLLASLLVTISAARPGQAQAISSAGKIGVCYLCASNNSGFGSFIDGPIFEIQNTSGAAITNGVLKVGSGGPGGVLDSFNVGTIGAGSTVYVLPGRSDDGGTGHTFFKVLCSACALDTSEAGPNTNDTPFKFTGRQGSNVIDSGVFTPAATQVAGGINFLGGPGNNDENLSCGVEFGSDCFHKTVADLSIPSAFSITVTHQLQKTGAVLFDYNPGGVILKETVDYTNSNPDQDPSLFNMQSTIQWLNDSPGWGNQFQSLVLGTPFQNKICLHQQNPNGAFACLLTTNKCRLVSAPTTDPFTGAACPKSLTFPTNFILETLEFENEIANPFSIPGPGVIEGVDNAQTCTPRPGCEKLENVFDHIGSGTIVVTIKAGHHSIFVPFRN
jgi:hypothetical protein